MPRVARSPRAARGRVRERQLRQRVQNQAHFQASPASGPDLFRHRIGRILRGGRCDRRAGGEEDHGGRILANFFGNDTARGVEARVPVLPLRVVRRGRRRRLPLPGRRPLDRLPRGALRDHDELRGCYDPRLSDRNALDPRHHALEAPEPAPPEAAGARQRVGVGGPRGFDSACGPRATERSRRVVRHDLPAKVLRVRVLQHPEAARVHVRGYGVRVAGPDHGTGRVRVSDDARDRTREPPPHLPGAVGLYVRHASRDHDLCNVHAAARCQHGVGCWLHHHRGGLPRRQPVHVRSGGGGHPLSGAPYTEGHLRAGGGARKRTERSGLQRRRERRRERRC
mmetsp:Transcript_87739/g.249620  ORF Transcript_87739/g.249620 Transcript_87739/m.249620 type:complete len:339 (+) Transcript_87739:1758-2774(+)